MICPKDTVLLKSPMLGGESMISFENLHYMIAIFMMLRELSKDNELKEKTAVLIAKVKRLFSRKG